MSEHKATSLAFSQTGFSYVEVLVATVLIATALVPALDALQPGIQASQIHHVQTENRYLLTAKMEAVLAEPFADLDAAAVATRRGAGGRHYFHAR
jgi:Tfp pilus assembly protein PilV